ncbi:MAG: alpha-mannosidase, partial [Lachnospiraceae bacterium]|nr:alpha-mannosidase [Lachnospiraceae bacterium]
MDFLLDKISRYLDELRKYMYDCEEELYDWKIKDCGYKPSGDILPVVDDSWRDFKKGDRWGTGLDSHCWFYKKFTVPEHPEGKRVLLYFNVDSPNAQIDNNPQLIVYVNGRIAHGIDHNHRFVALSGKEQEVFIYAYTGVWKGEHPLVSELVVKNEEIEKLYYNLFIPRECLKKMRENTTEYVDVLRRIDDAMNIVDFTVPRSESFYSSVAEANRFLDERFYGEICRDSGIHCVCIGHTHIDVAWLWTLAQTREKAVRSFSNVVDMMEEYPEYKFMSSQPQLYKYVKEDSPETYEKIKKFVKEGRWEPEGAMWVEADCNLTSGESLVRQILFGKRFFRDEFGVESRVLWLPDVFGYSAAIPQILRKSGVDKFVTSKIGWNEYNTMPYDSFWWYGIDGTEVFTWFLTAQDLPDDGKWETSTGYNANLTPSQVKGTWARYQ